MAWSASAEDADTQTAAEFTRCAAEKLTDMLCLRSDSKGMDRKRIMELIELFDRCGERLKVNTGVRHIMGLLAVDGIPDRKENQ